MMEVNRLLSDELSYELRIRNAPDLGTVQEKRSRLRGLLRLEKLGGAISFAPIVDVDAELETCRIKLNDLTYSARDFDVRNATNEHNRLQSRILHVINRLSRITDPRAAQFKSQLISQCATLTANLEDIVGNIEITHPASPPQQGSLMDAPIDLLPEVIHQAQQPVTSQVTLASVAHVDASVTQPGPSRVRFTDSGSPQNLLDSANVLPTVSQLNFSPASATDNRINIDDQSLVIPPFPPINTALQPQVETHLGAQSTNPMRYGIFPNSAADLNQYGYQYPGTGPTRTQNFVDVSREVHANELTSMGRSLREINLNNASSSSDYNQVQVHGRDAHDDSSRSCFVTVTRWQVSFDGRTSVTHFLQRIEELRIASGVTKPQLLKCASILFSGSTLEWYRANKLAIPTWDDLVHQLKILYLSDDYEECIMETIRNRFQRTGEKSAIYIAVMENYYNQLSQKPSESERLVTIRRRLLPYLQNKLVMHERNITTITDLTTAVRHIENTFSHTQKLRTHTDRNGGNRRVGDPVHTLYTEDPDVDFPDDAPGTSTSQTQALALTEPPSALPIPDTSTLSRVQQPTRVIKCYNCNQAGHHRINCPQPRVIRCYKCNTPNYTVRTCPNCSGNVNQVQVRVEP